MNTSTTHKVALITGAAHRIGNAITKTLHRHGFNIIIHYRTSADSAKELANQLNAERKNSATTLQADLTTHTEVKALSENALKPWGRIDVLINNASTFYPTPVVDAIENDWNTLINSNLKGPFFLSKFLAETLTVNHGCIINLIDIHSEKPLEEHAIYCIAKAGVAMMTKSLAKELAPHIRVNGISPGAILWPENDISEEEKSTTLNKVPLQRTGDAIDIANLALQLIENSPYITGQIIAVDGGRSLSM